jgi:hypothetical protein
VLTVLTVGRAVDLTVLTGCHRGGSVNNLHVVLVRRCFGVRLSLSLSLGLGLGLGLRLGLGFSLALG